MCHNLPNSLKETNNKHLREVPPLALEGNTRDTDKEKSTTATCKQLGLAGHQSRPLKLDLSSINSKLLDS